MPPDHDRNGKSSDNGGSQGSESDNQGGADPIPRALLFAAASFAGGLAGGIVGAALGG